MTTSDDKVGGDMDAILQVLRQYWGFDQLRPLQAEAIQAGLDRRDSLVVLPTGGGKSLCYQVPAAVAGQTDVVVSPLIALMKDQVDGLRQCGYPAIALYGGMSQDALQEAQRRIAAGEYRLVLMAPERVLTGRMISLFKRLPVRAFAIDEAHCISQWGHDFRPEYRQLADLKKHFPEASVHAYTATATPRVREDILKQLNLADPHVLIGTFDRPNLIYRVLPRTDVHAQTLEVVGRHKGQAVIVYCLSRRDTEEMAAFLRGHGVRAAAYHAGMNPAERHITQEEFSRERLDVVAATVAFGMGIDRSDVRCVVHATIPKSVEHYQQETGRAGRDGLEAECVLFYSAGDVMRWEGLIDKSALEAEDGERVAGVMKELLDEMRGFCTRNKCRHKMLSNYFGQDYGKDNCGACDVCLDEVDAVPEGTKMAQMILSCVARVEQRFGAGHVVDVLTGANTQRIRQCGHEKLSTHGLLKGMDKKALTNLVYQLIDQEVLARSDGEYPVLLLNEASWEVMRGRRSVRLAQPKGVKRTRTDVIEWEGVDRELFEELRQWRREQAEQKGVPAYLIFGDATLRELARCRPTTKAGLLQMRGIGQRKAREFATTLTRRIGVYCRENEVESDVDLKGTGATHEKPGRKIPSRKLSAGPKQSATTGRLQAFALFEQGMGIEQVARLMGKAASTVVRYLEEYIQAHKPPDISTWVDPATYQQVATAADEVGTARMKPIYEKLDGAVPYHYIRLVARHLDVRE